MSLIPFRNAAFYFVAHADDWQLFMAPAISKDISDKTCKVIIVHFTAGDAGRDERYWKAREQAAIDSVLFRLSADGYLSRQQEMITLNNKTLTRFGANNCCCYFLRLPDGAYDGTGFPAYQHQSLERLQQGNLSAISSVDGQVIYEGKKDLVDTIDQLIAAELREIDKPQTVSLNVTERNTTLNPLDHNDHYNTAIMVEETVAWSLYNKRAFVNYHIRHSNENLTGEELFWKTGMFCTYHQSLFNEYGHSTILEDNSFIPWCFSNNSFRDIQ